MNVKLTPIVILIGLVMNAFLISCKQNSESSNTNVLPEKTAVLLVNHGSRSETWRNALIQLEADVKDSLLAIDGIQEVRTAFMEYTGLSIATQLEALDRDGFTEVILVPVFLTVSSHSFDDIPTIIGQKTDPHSLETLKLEKIACYTPKAKVIITPLLDFTDLIKKNILRRYQAISVNPAEEGLVLIAYGDLTYNAEWTNLLVQTAEYVKANQGADTYSFGWCGHIAHYSPDSTSAPIERVLQTKAKAVVIPVLVAHDEMFQVDIIGGGIQQIRQHTERVLYKPDAILPDAGVSQWVIDAVKLIQNE